MSPEYGCGRRAGQAVHHAQIADTETKKLKGQIFDLERKAGLKPLIRPNSGVAPRMGDSLDVLGHIPWHPAGKGRSTTPLCKAGPELNNVCCPCCICMIDAVTAWSRDI